MEDIYIGNSRRMYSTKGLMDNIRCRKEPKKLEALNPYEEQTCKALAVQENKKDWVESSYSEVPLVAMVPSYLRCNRVAFIRKRSKHAMQSGTHNLNVWLLSYGHQGNWEYFLMGWKSTGDPLSPLELAFNNQQEAIEYCDKYGWDYQIEEERPEKPFKLKSYAQNYSYNKRTRVSTK